MKPYIREALPTLEQLDLMSGIELRESILQNSLGHVPKNASRGFLLGHLAWARQAAKTGFDPVSLRKSLLKKARHAKKPSTPLYKPGTRLVREWQGVTHEITIEDDGFTWNGHRYRSLSHIAREITGTRWSGPRFFGLTREG